MSTTTEQYLRDLHRKGYTAVPSEITLSNVLDLYDEISLLRERIQVRDFIDGQPADTRVLMRDVHANAIQALETGNLGDTRTARAMQEQEMLALNIVAAYVPPEPEPEFGSAKWFDDIEPIPF